MTTAGQSHTIYRERARARQPGKCATLEATCAEKPRHDAMQQRGNEQPGVAARTCITAVAAASTDSARSTKNCCLVTEMARSDPSTSPVVQTYSRSLDTASPTCSPAGCNVACKRRSRPDPHHDQIASTGPPTQGNTLTAPGGSTTPCAKTGDCDRARGSSCSANAVLCLSPPTNKQTT